MMYPLRGVFCPLKVEEVVLVAPKIMVKLQHLSDDARLFKIHGNRKHEKRVAVTKRSIFP
jgi:hypothetical protein